MESVFTKILLALVILPVIIISGIFLRKKSRPYNKALFSLHKTVSVVFIIFSVLLIRRFIISQAVEGLLSYLLILSVAFMITSFVTGALQSFEKAPPEAVNRVHRISSYLMFPFIPLTFILIYNIIN